MRRALGPYVTAVTAIVGGSCIAVAPVSPPAPDVQVRGVKLVDSETGIADIMAGSGTPIPSPDYVKYVFDLWLAQDFPNYTTEPVFYPAGNYALYTGVKSLTLNDSENLGEQILDKMITQQVNEGHDVVMRGQSQSSTVASMTMSELAAQNVSSEKVSFVLTGDPNLPNGGLFERADGFTTPSLGITFNGATPSDLYPTTIYTLEYDGFADVCQYPIDALCDLNSIAGIQYVHPTYNSILPPHVTSDQIANAIKLPTVGDTMTTYYMMPTQDLPLLDPLRAIPVVGNPLANLLQPDLEVLVNLGYGDPEYGWSQGPANVPTQFGLFPSLADLEKVPALLASGTQAGIHDFTHGISSSAASFMADPSAAVSGMLADLTTGLSSAASPADLLSALSPSGITDEFMKVVNALSGAASAAYATLLPTADVVNAVFTAMPAYDITLFTEGLKAGHLLEAVGQPIATDTYLLQMAGGFELFTIISQATTVAGDLSSIFP